MGNHENEIRKLEQEIYENYKKILDLRRSNEGQQVDDYTFATLEGDVTLRELFAGKSALFVIHNMGQGCRYCTLWADGINAFLPHLEEQFSVVLVSKDDPEVQRRFANERGWRFRMASHGGKGYIADHNIGGSGQSNSPGVVCYELKESAVVKKNQAMFGPGDEFCSLWHLLSLAGHDEETWTPQYSYWKRPQKLDDGGKNLL